MIYNNNFQVSSRQVHAHAYAKLGEDQQKRQREWKSDSEDTNEIGAAMEQHRHCRKLTRDVCCVAAVAAAASVAVQLRSCTPTSKLERAMTTTA